MTCMVPKAQELRRKAVELEEALRTVIRGKDEVIRLALVALLARGHLLIEGVPGVGKTTLAHALARAVDCRFQRVQFTSDLLPSDVLGVSVYSAKSESFEFLPGPVFTNILLADEINRSTPRTQSALLEAMNERQVTIDGAPHTLPEPFFVVATQNPVEHHGAYPLPESQLDRFLLRLEMGYPEEGCEREIVSGQAGAECLDDLKPVLTAAEIVGLQQQVRAVRVDDSLTDYALQIVRRSRQSPKLSLGVSPRGARMLYRAAQAMAYLNGRDFCTPADFKTLALPAFAHRVLLSARQEGGMARTAQAAAAVAEIVEAVPVPV
jgi:MoxR-like ATPase